jgi:hypothetical protein
MEEQILKIINKVGFVDNTNPSFTFEVPNAAKEITSLITHFMDWVKSDVEGDYNVGSSVLQWRVYCGYNNNLWFTTTEELFQYWINKK